MDGKISQMAEKVAIKRKTVGISHGFYGYKQVTNGYN